MQKPCVCVWMVLYNTEPGSYGPVRVFASALGMGMSADVSLCVRVYIFV